MTLARKHTMFRPGYVWSLAILLFLGIAVPAFAAEQKFEPGELVIGYATPNDRDNAMKKLNSAKDIPRVRGERLDALEAKPIAENAIKVRLTLPARVLRATRNNPSEELAVLQDVAKQLRENDPSVRYAHPSWIADAQTPSPAQPEKAAPQASHHTRIASAHRTAHKHSRASAMAWEFHHRATQHQWWDFDFHWSFSFSPHCWQQKGRHSHGHRSRLECPRDAMR
jgi:hypothetical protein